MHRKFFAATISFFSLFVVASLLTATLSFAVEGEKNMHGRLVDVNSSKGTITVNMKGKLMKYKVADDAHWHICLKDSCAEVKGAEGFKIIDQYAQFEEYGLPLKSYAVAFYKEKGKPVSDLQVEIVPGKHKKK